MQENGWESISWIGFQRDSLTGQFVWIDEGTNPDYLGWGEGGKIYFQSKMIKPFTIVGI